MVGGVARLTHTQSAFGERMDSLADMVSFGAAPALIAYEWALRPSGAGDGLLHSSIAPAQPCGWRVSMSIPGWWTSGTFRGSLPRNRSSGHGFIWLTNEMIGAHREVPWFGHSSSCSPEVGSCAVICPGSCCPDALFRGLTMVTNIPYYGFQGFWWQTQCSLYLSSWLVLVIAVINIEPPTMMLFAFFVCLCAERLHRLRLAQVEGGCEHRQHLHQ